MTFRDLTAAAKVLAMVMVLVSLGSCGIVQYTDNRSFNYAFSLEMASSKKHCGLFERKIRIGHNEPVPPQIDPRLFSDADQMAELALTHAEKLKIYIDNERRYLAEDIARHLETCK